MPANNWQSHWSGWVDTVYSCFNNILTQVRIWDFWCYWSVSGGGNGGDDVDGIDVCGGEEGDDEWCICMSTGNSSCSSYWVPLVFATMLKKKETR